MKKVVTAENDLEARQGILFPEIVDTDIGIGKPKKTEKKNRAREKKTGGTDSQIESMSPNEFAKFLRNRDKSRYERAKLILQEENNK